VGRLVGGVARSGIHEQKSAQFSAWRTQLAILKRELADDDFQDWFAVLEFEIPRRQRRPDLVLLCGGLVFVVEFKVGSSTHDALARSQVVSYCMDLRDFHAETRGRILVPVLCATDSSELGCPNLQLRGHDTRITGVVLASGENLGRQLHYCATQLVALGTRATNPESWLQSPYRPTASIIEAAVQLYDGHGIREITHRHAHNLDLTTAALVREIDVARRQNRRVICFVTGIPGAGKTLTGLDVVHSPEIRGNRATAGIFLSGNGPLVNIIREALVNSQRARNGSKGDSEREVKTFVQNVHHFLRYYRDFEDEVPNEHVVVFDEAQRAWDRNQMNRKNNIDSSEASLLIGVMERLPNWAVIIALVGGGQEIYLGEAGLEEWGKAIENRDAKWEVVASLEVLEGGPSVAGHKLFSTGMPAETPFRPEPLVHLSVGVRSHRAGQWTEWVNDVLSLRMNDAIEKFPDSSEFPCFLTRDLESARKWLRNRLEDEPGTRIGLVASSQDERIRAHGIEVSSAFRQNYPYGTWFLAPPENVRSSFMLEVAASEFECQGLELDWTGVCWGGDLLPAESLNEWNFRKFRGTKWQTVHNQTEQEYSRNRYRVLLTRARMGIVIWVPAGSASDPTRQPAHFDRIFEVLKSAGVPTIES